MAIVEKTENIVIAAISSKLLAASIIYGIPFATPLFYSMSDMTDGTKTAGLTAPIQNP